MTRETQMCGVPREQREEIRREAKAKYLDREGKLYLDVKLVMSQVGCTEDVAAEALVAQEGDIVNAIVELTLTDDEELFKVFAPLNKNG